jgi:NAD(P)-dependent dehydrogenase (short-subunit alcohol dehydrogenase family)
MADYTIDFITTQHTHPSPIINPSTVHLPSPFTVCIIGASRGIGASIAHCYALAGTSTLILAARSSSALDAVATECRALNSATSVLVEACDITCASDVQALAARIQGHGLDVVVVNAGFAGPVVTRVTDGDPADWQRCLSVNSLGPYHAAHYLVPLLLNTSAGAKAFVVVSAAAAWITGGLIANTAYCVSKLAQVRLVEMMATQYEADGLLSVAVHPGAVATQMAQTAPDEFKDCEFSSISFPLRYEVWIIVAADIHVVLVDSPDLCGAFCVWLTREVKATLWLSGRYVSARWDVGELLGRRQEIVEKDLLKARLAVS